MCFFSQRLTSVPAVLLALVLLGGCDGTVTPPAPPDVQRVDRTPAWSPDGRFIAYFHDARPTTDTTDVTGLYVLDLDADSTWLVSEGFAASPDWRPDGERIAFAAGDIFTIRPDGSDFQRVTTHGRAFFPSWSPDGDRIAYDATSLAQNGIWLVDPDGENRKNLGLGRYPDWSAQGERLIYEGPPGISEGGPQLWNADTSGVDSLQVTDNEFVNNRYPDWSLEGDWTVWSPITGDGIYEIWVMKSDGTEQRKLVDRGREPAWGPRSERIVFSRPAAESDYTALWTIRRDGSELRQITDPPRKPLN